ncbi:MAG TPA: maleylpyruvate isomerase family mycothiol-dependent enzyme [Microthrixaceae bacterium]|nr:maleylpyruvate isomerase family mycothiol-dependent enzyme [Microthrixaceae bacterium]
MQLTPVYGDTAVLRADPALADPATPLLRQRARLAGFLADLDDEQWSVPTRCEGWSVQDVVAHLVTTNQFWAFSIDAGLRGEPTRFLATFDPVASPAEMVEAVRSATPEETLSGFVETNAALAAAIGRIDGAWSTIAEAPPGHLEVGLVVQHALWDSWVHERDVVLPLGMTPTIEHDEVVASLHYAAALGPAFLVSRRSERRGSVEVCVSAPDLRVVVDLGPQVVLHDGPAPDDAVRITGDAVEVLEAMSFRGPFPTPLAEDERWVIAGLAQAFDTTV